MNKPRKCLLVGTMREPQHLKSLASDRSSNHPMIVVLGRNGAPHCDGHTLTVTDPNIMLFYSSIVAGRVAMDQNNELNKEET